MAATLTATLPIFALILAGWALVRSRRMPAEAGAALNGFVVRLALPALLFQFVAEAEWRALWQPGFVAAVAIGVAAIFAAHLGAATRTTPFADRVVDALAASYANTAFMGVPIAGALFGALGTAAAVIASILTVCVLFGCAILLMEAALHREQGLAHMAARTIAGVVRNPLVAAPLLGAAWAAGGLPLPAVVHRLLTLAGAAASPVALVSIGMFLADVAPAGERRPIAAVLLLKLVGQPALTWLACRMLAVPPPWTGAAVLIAALPTGTGPFMAAALHGRNAATPARIILAGTILSALSIPLVAWLVAS